MNDHRRDERAWDKFLALVALETAIVRLPSNEQEPEKINRDIFRSIRREIAREYLAIA